MAGCCEVDVKVLPNFDYPVRFVIIINSCNIFYVIWTERNMPFPVWRLKTFKSPNISWKQFFPFHVYKLYYSSSLLNGKIGSGKIRYDVMFDQNQKNRSNDHFIHYYREVFQLDTPCTNLPAMPIIPGNHYK